MCVQVGAGVRARSAAAPGALGAASTCASHPRASLSPTLPAPSVGSDSEAESGGLSSVPTDRSEEQQMELDVQTFQLEEVAAMDVRTGDSSSTTRMPRVDVDPRRAQPMGQAAV